MTHNTKINKPTTAECIEIRPVNLEDWINILPLNVQKYIRAQLIAADGMAKALEILNSARSIPHLFAGQNSGEKALTAWRSAGGEQ